MDKQYKRLDKFLFCCRLETGGYVFGWLGVIHCILATILFVLVIVGLTSDSITDDTFQSMGFGNQGSTQQDMTNIKQAFMIVSIVGIIGSLFYFVIAVILIFGTKNKTPKLVLPAVIFFGVASICAIIGLYNFSISAVFNVAYCIYGLLITYSIYRLFQEYEDKPNGMNSYGGSADQFAVQQPVTTIA